METATQTKTVTLTAKQFRDIASLGSLTSGDSGRPLLTGVHVIVKDNKLTAEATDSYVLGQLQRDVIGDDLEALIPAKYLDKVSKAMGKKFFGEVTIETHSIDITVSYNNGAVQAYGERLIDGTYPNTATLFSGALDKIGKESVREAGAITTAFNLDIMTRIAKVCPWNSKELRTTELYVTDSRSAMLIKAKDKEEQQDTTVLLMPLMIK